MLLQVHLTVAPLLTSQQSTIIQRTTGWCNPVISNVTGKVTVTCEGVDPRALQRLNALLNRKNQKLREKIQEANEWAGRYHELEKQLSESDDEIDLSRQAEEYVRRGDLESAGEILDHILTQDLRHMCYHLAATSGR